MNTSRQAVTISGLNDSGWNLAASHCLKYSRYIDMLVTQATLSAPYFDSLCALALIAIPIKTAIINNLLVFISVYIKLFDLSFIVYSNIVPKWIIYIYA